MAFSREDEAKVELSARVDGRLGAEVERDNPSKRVAGASD